MTAAGERRGHGRRVSGPAPGNRNLVSLRLENDRIEWGVQPSGDAATPMPMQLGYRTLADDILHSWPPTGGELEHAIEIVEDEIMRSGARAMPGVRLAVSGGPIAQLLVRLRASSLSSSAAVPQATVEQAFQDLAAVSLGRPASAVDPARSRDEAAALLILRELMHHLGIEDVIEPPGNIS